MAFWVEMAPIIDYISHYQLLTVNRGVKISKKQKVQMLRDWAVIQETKMANYTMLQLIASLTLCLP